MKANLIERLESNIFYSPDGCWYWLGAQHTSGYGHIKETGKRQPEKTHRISYTLYKGEIPKGLFVCHSCDNKLCVNPDHLWVGTCKDNNRDALKKGRKFIARGSQTSLAKVNEMQVLEIRASNDPAYIIAKNYGLSKRNVWTIRARQSWKHI